MNPLLVEALASIFRSLLQVIAGYLVAHDVWTQANAEQYVGAFALFLVSLIWSIWQKYRSRLKLLVALATPQALSEKRVEQEVKLNVQLPSVTTPKNEVPR